jgi:rhombotail lipoprotein
MKTLSKLAILPLLALLSAGCSANREMAMARSPEAPAAMPAPPPVLQRSLFSKDSTGSLEEGDLQRVLESPIDLQFPARVGVVPLAEPFNPQGPVSIATRSVAARDLARALVGQRHFSHVSDISTELPNMGGIEGLRVIAARYRMRYLLLYSERFEDATHLNGWAWLYPTVVGMFVAPGVTVESRGLAQADLLDVRTGTILFSVVQPLDVSERSLMIGAARSHQDYQREAAAKGAKALAKRVVAQTVELVAWADQAAEGRGLAKTRILPAPVVASPEGGAIRAESKIASP